MGRLPPQFTPRVWLEHADACLKLLSIRLPKSVALPAEAIVMYWITSVLLPSPDGFSALA